MSINQKQILEFETAVAHEGAKVIEKAKNIVRKKLVVFIGVQSTEYTQMAEDFVANAQLSLLQGIRKKQTEKFTTVDACQARQAKLWDQFKTEKNHLERYIIGVVSKECDTRCIRWSHDINTNKIDKGEREEQFPIEEDRTKENGKRFAVRARHSRVNFDTQTDEDWMAVNSEVLRSDIEDYEPEAIKKLNDYLSQKKLTRDEYTLIMQRLDGNRFKYLAELYNEKQDTVRVRYKRALEKLGLSPSDLKIKK
ncbi:hypothetical protein HWV00_04360 [Moritella sp. 24]|uniref:hypothetical protein n=1 Tax=Moritella sp. 24 TaxID=2746230 RepID=UPI001BA95CBB|nr:hypothetical protein [Moritella sp. 24]QUM75527.1 hypothetical protein HWV00_04360 [Moritella sp. 24]